jgi:hypothetical protein
MGRLGRAAYVLSNVEAPQGQYEPIPDYNWNTKGIPARVTPAGTGRYTVLLPGMMTVGSGPFGGVVQVSSVSTGSGGAPPPHCYFVGSFISGTDLNLQVDCADLMDGTFENAMFSLIYVQ